MNGVGLSAKAQSAPASTSSSQVKAHAREILSQPEFRGEAPDSPLAQLGRTLRQRWEQTSKWLTARWNAFVKWFNGLFSGLGRGAGGAAATAIPIIFGALFIGLGGWLIALLIRNIAIQNQQKQAKARTAYDEDEADAGLALEPNAWIQQAETYAESDDYRRAFRAVFVAILLLLDEGGQIEFDRSRTNGDYLLLLRKKNIRALYELLGPLVIEFDRRWYGRAETSVEDYKRVQQTFERIRSTMSEQTVGMTPAPAAGKG